ncbi:MFS transporter [Chloroflexota bacterium]
MNNRLSSGLKRIQGVYNQWGGGPSALFAYTHGSHDQCAGLLTAMLPFIREDLGLSYLQAGFLLSAYSVTAGASQLPGGWLGDRVKKYIIIATGLFGIGAAALAIGFSQSFTSLLVIYIIMGIFAGAYHPSAVSLISSYHEEEKRGKVIAVHMLGGSFGFAMGPILGAIIAGAFGWRYAYILLCIPALLAVPVVLRKVRQWENASSAEQNANQPIENDGTDTTIPRRLSIIEVLRPILAVTILAIIMQLVVGSAVSFFPLYLVDKQSVSPAYASILVGIIRVGGVAGSLLGGWLSDRWGRKNSITLALAATGPLLFFITQLPLNITLMIIFFVFGMFVTMRQSTVQPYLMSSTPHYLRATVFGIYFGLGIEGQSLLQPGFGYLVDTFGVTEIFQLIAFAGIVLSALALFLGIKQGLLKRIA